MTASASTVLTSTSSSPPLPLERSRGVACEQHINRDYLRVLVEAYARFFHFYDEAPLLIVNATEVDLAGNDDHYRELIERDATLGEQRLGALRPLADALRLRQVLRLPQRRDRPVVAQPDRWRDPRRASG